MICQRCLFRLRAPSTFLKRLYSTPVALSSIPTSLPLSSVRGPRIGSHESRPTAVATSAAQAFSTAVSASGTVDQIEDGPKSSVPAGTPLKGLGYFKGRDPPVAMEDGEYPPWLWTLLDDGQKKKSKSEGVDAEGDLYARSKKQRRLAKRAVLKAAKEDPESFLPKVPLEHQSIDLPAGDGSLKGTLTAARVREELTVAMRQARRKEIKEANYLKGMR